MYNFKDSKANILNILKSKTLIKNENSIPKSEKDFTYENGIKTCVSSIFVDIKNSSALFARRDEKLARLLRAFSAEIITIFQESEQYREIGLRGDCVYGIYSTPKRQDIVDVFDIAILTNTFMKMFNELLKENHYTTIGAGIGLGCGEDLIIKAGRSGTGINDKIWIGEAVVDASNLSSIANRNGYGKIAMNSCFYKKLTKQDAEYSKWIHKVDEADSDFNKAFYQYD